MNDMPQRVTKKPVPQKEVKDEKKTSFLGGLQLETDDLILAVILLALIADECEDKLLIIALGFVFITGLLDNN